MSLTGACNKRRKGFAEAGEQNGETGGLCQARLILASGRLGARRQQLSNTRHHE